MPFSMTREWSRAKSHAANARPPKWPQNPAFGTGFAAIKAYIFAENSSITIVVSVSPHLAIEAALPFRSTNVPPDTIHQSRPRSGTATGAGYERLQLQRVRRALPQPHQEGPRPDHLSTLQYSGGSTPLRHGGNPSGGSARRLS